VKAFPASNLKKEIKQTLAQNEKVHTILDAQRKERGEIDGRPEYFQGGGYLQK